MHFLFGIVLSSNPKSLSIIIEANSHSPEPAMLPHRWVPCQSASPRRPRLWQHPQARHTRQPRAAGLLSQRTRRPAVLPAQPPPSPNPSSPDPQACAPTGHWHLSLDKEPVNFPTFSSQIPHTVHAGCWSFQDNTGNAVPLNTGLFHRGKKCRALQRRSAPAEYFGTSAAPRPSL